MRNGSDAGAAVVVIGAVLLLLLLAAGGGFFYLARSQQAEVAQAERARMAEIQARRQAEQALMDVRESKATRTTSQDATAHDVLGDSIPAAVETMLRAQEKAWNDGDLEAFMDHYWKSEALTFSSGGETTRGWTATLNRYRERYPTRDKMGHLTLSDFEITLLGDSAALVLGRWQVQRDSEPLKGNFSLVTRKIDGHCVVVHDHTSREPE